MTKPVLLWVDDEIDLLRPHILFLEQKGYEVATATNGQDALRMCRSHVYDLILLDENMPGLTGLEVLPSLKEIHPDTPVVMVTKSEEEDLMEEAIGSKIADYLIKPVNPNQILLSLKNNIHRKEIVNDKTTLSYQQAYRKLSMQMDDCRNIRDWYELYKQLVYWKLELRELEGPMASMLKQQGKEANAAFARFVKKNYSEWVGEGEIKDRPLMSPNLFKEKLIPMLDKGENLFFVLVDNLRFDQWKIISKMFGEYFTIEEELYTSILPTSTQYARNALFSGLMPDRIEKTYPELWVDEDKEEGKNLNEEPMIAGCLSRCRRDYSFSYNKVYENQYLERLVSGFTKLGGNRLNVVVLNFIDMLSHARTDSHIVRQLASSEAGYLSLTESWFKHSAVIELFKQIAAKGYKVVLTTDHGSIQVDTPQRVVGLKETSANLRYKHGRLMSYDESEVFEIRNPQKVGLPSPNLTTSYIFASGTDFFVYPNGYNHYAAYYKDTFQHGGISMEEMLVPLITMTPR